MNLDKIVKPSILLIFLYMLLGSALWVLSFFGSTGEKVLEFNRLTGFFGTTYFFYSLLGLVLTFLNGALLLQLFNRFSFVETRTFVPAFVFGLLMATWYHSQLLFLSHIALLLFLCALFCFFNMVEKPTAEKSFLGSFLIAIASLLVNPLILILPACWLGFFLLRSMSLRIFLASVLGVLAVYLLYASLQYVIMPEFFWNKLIDIDFQFGICILYLPLPAQIYFGLLFCILLITIFGTYANFHKQANSIRRNTNFILILLVSFVALFVLQRNFKPEFFPFIALCSAILISQLFSVKKERFYAGLFYFFILLNIAFTAYLFIR